LKTIVILLAVSGLVVSVGSPAEAQALAYVVGQPSNATGNRGPQFLNVIDTATLARVATIPLGTSCLCVNANGAVASADGTRIYVSNYWDNTISVIDTGTNTVVRTLNVQPFPTALAVSPDGTRLYVNAVITPNPGYVVQVLDVATGGTIATIPLNVPQSGSGMVISRDGTRLYVSNTALNASSISQINTATNTVMLNVQVGTTPRGLDISADGSFVYAAVQNSNALTVMQTNPAFAVAVVPVGQLPLAVRLTPNGGRAYVVNSTSNNISVVSTSGRAVVATVPATLPRAIDFTPDGTRGFVAADGRVYVLDTATNTITGNIPFAAATEGNPGIVVIPQTVGVPPDPPIDLVATSISGNAVTLRWKAAFSGTEPTGFVVEGGINPGQVLGSLPTGSAARSFTFTAPSGAFYVRVHATNRGGRSAASNEIRIFVGVANAPSPPADFLGLVNGTSLTLTWRNTFLGGAPTSLMLDVTGSLSVSLPMAVNDTFSFVGVPPGTYTLALRALNGSVSSAPSNPITLTFPTACSGVPGAPANFHAYRVGRTITVLWDSPSSGAAPTGYRLDVSGAVTTAIPTTSKSMSGTVGPGSYSLSVAATNPCGSSVATPVQVVIVP
jgi:YVTN family beta-propeller protein